MKRIGIFLFVVICLIIPINVNASNAEIIDYEVDVNIKENGSAEILEHIKLSNNVSFTINNNYLDCNGLNKTMYSGLQNDLYGSDIYVPKISDKKEILDKTREPIVNYNIETTQLGEKYIINNKDEIYIKYTLDDIIVTHSDKSEFYYNFFKDKFDMPIKKATIKISLPKHSSYLKALDYSYSNNIKIDGDTVTFKYQTVKDKNIRIVFDKGIALSKKNTDKIITGFIESDINNGTIEKAKYWGCILLTILFYIYFIRLIIMIIIKYGKNKKYNVAPSLDETLIKKINYAGINYLINKDITVDALMAGIIDLINSEKLNIEKNSNGQFYFVRGSSNTRNYTMDEEYLINFLLEIIDKKYNAEVDTLSFSKLKQFCLENTSVSSFIVNFNVWKTIQVKQSREYRFMVGNEYYFSLKKSLIFSYILLALNILAKTNFALGIVAFIPTTFLVNALFKLTKRSQVAEETYKDVLKFKEGLKVLAPKTTDEYRWDLFLVDGITIGYGKETENIIKAKIKNNTLKEHYESKIIQLYRTYPDLSIVNEFLPIFTSAYKKSFYIYTKGKNNL